MSAFVLESLQALQQEVQNTTLLQDRKGNLNVYYSDVYNQEIANCHLHTILPFTVGDKSIFNAIGNYEGGAAIALAATHFNEGKGHIIPALANLPERCSIKMTVEFQDTELQERIATDHVISATDRRPSEGQVRPCTFLGAARSAVSIPTSIVSGLRGYVQLSAISTSAALDDAAQYPLFGRTIPSDDGTALPVMDYFARILKVQHLAVIHINDAYGNAYAQGLQVAAQQYEMQLQTVDLPVEATEEQVANAIQLLKATEFRYFFGIVFPTRILDVVLEQAVAQGIAGTGVHNWIFSDSTGSDLVSRRFERDSPLAKAVQGAGVIAASAGLPEFNPLLASLTEELQSLKQNPKDLAFLDSLYPRHDGDVNFGNGFDVYADSFLQSPGLMGAFLYDAVVAAGLAACTTYKVRGNLTGAEHFAALVDQEPFAATSGQLVLNSVTGTRDPTSAFFQLINHVVDTDATASSDPDIQYKGVLSDIFQNAQWTSLQPYVFNDGTTTIPPDLKELNTDYNHLSTGLRAGGLLMGSLAMAAAVGLAVWTHSHRHLRVIKASQPIFLYIICAGALILASTIIPLSMDDGVTSIRGCDIACQAVPWLLSIGFSVMFSALFTKTYRINKIFNNPQFRRITVTVMDVAKPMIVLLGLNVIVLSVWTALYPFEWSFETISKDKFGRIEESYGYCYSTKLLPFAVTLLSLNVSALAFAIFQAYQARHISTEFAESQYIFTAMVSILIVCFVGIPVLILAQENPDAYFFVFSAIVFITCMAVLLFIFVPKIQARNSQVVAQSRASQFSSLPSTYESDAEVDGIKILTVKTPEELIQENKRLKRRLRVPVNSNSGPRQSSVESEEPSESRGGYDRTVKFAAAAPMVDEDESTGQAEEKKDSSSVQQPKVIESPLVVDTNGLSKIAQDNGSVKKETDSGDMSLWSREL